MLGSQNLDALAVHVVAFSAWVNPAGFVPSPRDVYFDFTVPSSLNTSIRDAPDHLLN
jgi:hypothetical protein